MQNNLPNPLLFRQARPAEQRALEDLQRRASLMLDEDRDWLIANPDAIELPVEQIYSGRVIVAERVAEQVAERMAERINRVMGFAVVLRRDDGDGELDGLFVEPDAWRQGIGRALVDAAITLALADGASSVWVIANSHAVDFYAACDFLMQGEVPTQFRPARQMRKMIRSDISLTMTSDHNIRPCHAAEQA